MQLIAVTIILLAFIQLPVSEAQESWIRITQPSPGIYFHGDKILSLKSAVVIIGENILHIEAEGSSNIIAVYFSVYDAMEKDMVASYWDVNSNDGWGHDFELTKGIYIVTAAGAAIDIDEPVAIDWIMLFVWVK